MIARWRRRGELRAGADGLVIVADPLVQRLQVPWTDVAGAALVPPSPFERDVHAARPVRIVALTTDARKRANLLIAFRRPQRVQVTHRRRLRSRVEELAVDGVVLYASDDSGVLTELTDARLVRGSVGELIEAIAGELDDDATVAVMRTRPHDKWGSTGQTAI